MWIDILSLENKISYVSGHCLWPLLTCQTISEASRKTVFSSVHSHTRCHNWICLVSRLHSETVHRIFVHLKRSEELCARSRHSYIHHVKFLNEYVSKNTENDIKAFLNILFCFTVCDQLSKHIIAMFGPVNADIATYTGSACSSLQIPHIETRVDTNNLQFSPLSINLHPDAQQLSRAVLDVIKHFGWSEVLILYSNHIGKLHPLVRRFITWKPLLRIHALLN